MKRKLMGLLLAAAMLGLAQPVWGDDFYVIVAGGGVGTPIINLPYTINQSGFYYLKGNLSYSGTGNAISIEANDVTLDLMGFCLTGPGPKAESGVGINHIGNVKNVEVRNGHVKNFHDGLYSGAGQSHRFTNLKVRSCVNGIYALSQGTIISGCEATDNDLGIKASLGSLLDRNTASYNSVGGFSLNGGVVINNAAYNNGTGFSFYSGPVTVVDHNSSSGNTTNWYQLDTTVRGINAPPQ